MNVILIDGVPLPTPDNLQYKEADLQSTGYRDEAGYMHKKTVRWGVRTLSASWNRQLKNAEISLIRNTCKGKEYVTITYYSDREGFKGKFTCYTGDLDYQLIRINSETDARWGSTTLNFIEQ